MQKVFVALKNKNLNSRSVDFGAAIRHVKVWKDSKMRNWGGWAAVNTVRPRAPWEPSHSCGTQSNFEFILFEISLVFASFEINKTWHRGRGAL
jgi:hypothetical protein